MLVITVHPVPLMVHPFAHTVALYMHGAVCRRFHETVAEVKISTLNVVHIMQKELLMVLHDYS